MAGQVFISYSREDAAAMRRIVKFLRKQGIKVWVDNEKLVPGTPIWEVEVEKAIRGAGAVVVLLSPNSNYSPWVRREISFAEDNEKRIFPILIAGDERNTVPIRLTTHQRIDIRQNEETGLNALSTALSFYLEDLAAREQSAREEDERLAHEKAVREKAEREIAEKADKEKAIREAAELAEREAAKKVAQEKAEREAAEKAARKRILQQEATRVSKHVHSPKPKKRGWMTAIVAILIIALCIWGISSLNNPHPPAWEEPVAEEPVTEEIITEKPVTEEPAKTEEYSIGSTIISEVDNMTMVYVPTGEFEMGNNADNALAECQKFHSDCERDSFIDEEPIHIVYLDAFWIDQTEVTNAMYAKCVGAGACNPPSSTESSTRDSYYGNSEFDDFPVINVSWDDAISYCEWAGRRLPSEAEWEKAASWDEIRQQKNGYPWGNSIDCTFANFVGPNGSCVGEITPVRSYEKGKSPYGAYDMGGNVEEWVEDWYEVYPGGDVGDPGTLGGKNKILRGGDFARYPEYVRSTYRFPASPVNSNTSIGFRCSRSP